MTEFNYKVYDLTIQEIDKRIETDLIGKDKERHYLGMSGLHECWRHLFYAFRNADIKKQSLIGWKATQDGHYQEKKMAEYLRLLPEIELYTEDPENPGHQIEFETLLGHFRGHCDGIVWGILEAPKTWHIWECKAKDEKFINSLLKIREESGEKDALKEWNIVYYNQAQIYMHMANLQRHYLTVCYPGGRRSPISIRTEYKRAYAEDIIEKVRVVIFENWDLPSRMSSKREFYQCQWCDFQEICHDFKFPLVHCKTCRYREPTKNFTNTCLLKEEIIPENILNIGCEYHIYNPALIQAQLLEQQREGCLYYIKATNTYFFNTNITGMPDIKTEKDIDFVYDSKTLREKIKHLHNIKKDQEKDHDSKQTKRWEKKPWDR